MEHERINLCETYSGSNKSEAESAQPDVRNGNGPAAETTTTHPVTRLQSDASNVTIEEQISVSNNGVAAKSCLVRGSSTKSLIKKHVNYNESTEMIPASERNSLGDDDEVFSDSVAPPLPRGDMCAPYLTKRGSMPGLVALPDWFGLERFREEGGVLEPPVTPVGRDELALKRHRLFSEFLAAAQAATEHRVRFNPWGPNVAGVQQEQQQQQQQLIGN